MSEIELGQSINQIHVQMGALQSSVDTFHSSSLDTQRRMESTIADFYARLQKHGEWIAGCTPVLTNNAAQMKLLTDNQDRMVILLQKHSSWIDTAKGGMAASSTWGRTAIAVVSLLCTALGALGALTIFHK
jgi:hypothetical protein